MSLNFDFGKIKDFESVCYERVPIDEVTDEMRNPMSEWTVNEECALRYNPVTSTLIHCTMFIDMGSITEKNAADFYSRVALWEKINGCFVRTRERDDAEEKPEGIGWTGEPGAWTRVKDRPITPEDVRAHIGLSCNVATVARRSWAGKLALRLLDEGTRTFERSE